MGDHTDYNEGVALPMAIDLGTTVEFVRLRGSRVVMVSTWEPAPADIDLPVRLDPSSLRTIEPAWSRYVAAMLAVLNCTTGGRGTIDSTLPVGAGLSSSAALEVALAFALGFEAEPRTMARTCQRAEQAATGVSSGLMDQFVVSAAEEGCALLIDFTDLSASRVRLPEDVEWIVVHSGKTRALQSSPYRARRAECEAAAYRLAPLGHLRPEDLVNITDPVLRRRARHVVSECDRVKWFAQALEHHDLQEAGRLMKASHASLANDFEVTTPALDELVEHLCSRRGVYGARMTGAGFGGCVVALSEPGALDLRELRTAGWRVRPSQGARHLPA